MLSFQRGFLPLPLICLFPLGTPAKPVSSINFLTMSFSLRYLVSGSLELLACCTVHSLLVGRIDARTFSSPMLQGIFTESLSGPLFQQVTTSVPVFGVEPLSTLSCVPKTEGRLSLLHPPSFFVSSQEIPLLPDPSPDPQQMRW